MAINFHVSESCYKKDKLGPRTVHFMPCKIKYDGPCNFSKYVHIKEMEDQKDVLATSFRGHPLMGKELKLPENYVGVLFEKSKNFDGSDKKVYATRAFDSFIHWNWDKIPNKNDVIIKALDWLDIAEVLHSQDLDEPAS